MKKITNNEIKDKKETLIGKIRYNKIKSKFQLGKVINKFIIAEIISYCDFSYKRFIYEVSIDYRKILL